MKKIVPFVGSREEFVNYLILTGKMSITTYLNSLIDNEYVDASKNNQRGNAPYSYVEDYYIVALVLDSHTIEFISKIVLRSPNALRTRLAFLVGTASWLKVATLSSESKDKIRNYFRYCYENQVPYELRINVLETVEILEFLHYYHFDADNTDRAGEECK